MSGGAQAQGGVADPRAAAEVFIAATAAGDADAIAALYAPDALLLGPNLPPISGREAIRTVNRQNLQRGRSSIRFTSITADLGASHAVVLWSWVFEQITTDGKRERQAGRSLVYFKRGAQGWLISADMFQPIRE